jgi:hypothetical protein
MAVVLGTVVLVLAAAGCGSDSKKTASPSGTTDPSQKGLTGAALAPVNLDLEAGPTGGPVPLKTHFQVDAPNSVGNVLYRWRFDDGTSSTEQNPTHVFTQPGFYLVVINTRDSKGNVRTRGAFIGAWSPAQWNKGQRSSIGHLDVEGRKKAMWARTFKRRAAVAAKVRAEQRRQAASSL